MAQLFIQFRNIVLFCAIIQVI